MTSTSETFLPRCPWSGLADAIGRCLTGFALLFVPMLPCAYAASPVALGLGSYTLIEHDPDPSANPGAIVPPLAPQRAEGLAHEAIPSNTWFASLAYERWAHPIIAHPLSYRPTPQGLEISFPEPRIASQPSGMREVDWPHTAQIRVAPTAFQPEESQLVDFGDWHVTLALRAGADRLAATIGHGSPYSYYRITRGDAMLHFMQTPAEVVTTAERSMKFRLGAHWFAVFAPSQGHLEPVAGDGIRIVLGGAHYFTIAALPDGSDAAFGHLRDHAFAFIRDTRVQWDYQPSTSEVITHYQATTDVMEGTETTPILGLYPHQWNHLQGTLPDISFPSVRGPIRLLTAATFDTRMPYTGILPFWPDLPPGDQRERVLSLLKGDVAKTPGSFSGQGTGTYWTGKGLGRAAQLLAIASVLGDTTSAARLRDLLEAKYRDYFSGKSAYRHFSYDPAAGTFVGFPEEYWNITHMNDHHFHYGYWIHAAALLALADPDWAQTEHWGGMVRQLVEDIAHTGRHDASYPRLRNFDPYEGHSWAGGDAAMDAGNNQESSSEAMNAWAGLILWGSVTGDVALRNLGIALYTTEAEAIRTYWYDTRAQVFDPAYQRAVAAQVFGSKYSYNTWWTQNPREIQGINLLPFTPASLYLPTDPAAIQSFFDGLVAMQKTYAASGEGDETPADIWQDIYAEYYALMDARKAESFWRDRGSVEAGESRTHTLYWINSLQALGTPRQNITADTPLYAVFERADGVRQHLAFNPGAEPVTARFSDGFRLTVPPHSLAQGPAADGTSTPRPLTLRVTPTP